MDQKTVVVGAGIVGASIAYHLSKNGGAVTLLDQQPPGSGATTASFAWINAHTPKNQAYHELRAAGIAEYRTLEAGPDLAVNVHWGGSLSWEVKGPSLEDQLKKINGFGHPARKIDQNEFAELEPDVADPPAQCLFCPTEGAIDAVHLTQTMTQAASSNGAYCLFGCAVSGLITHAGQIAGVQTNFGPIEADTVVVAAGIATAPLLAQAVSTVGTIPTVTVDHHRCWRIIETNGRMSLARK